MVARLGRGDNGSGAGVIGWLFDANADLVAVRSFSATANASSHQLEIVTIKKLTSITSSTNIWLASFVSLYLRTPFCLFASCGRWPVNMLVGSIAGAPFGVRFLTVLIEE